MHSILLASLLALPLAAPAPCPGAPPGDAVARRAVALGLVASRVWLEIKLQRVRTDAQVKQLRARAQELTRRQEAWHVAGAYSAAERALMKRPLGTWSRTEVADHSWAMEEAGALLWAVGAVPTIPEFDQPYTQVEALKPIMLANGGEQVLRKASLRPGAELARAREEAALFSWRVKAERARRAPLAAPSATVELPEDLRAALRRAAESQLTSRTNGADLTVGVTTLAAVDRRKLGLISSVARSRQAALAWACPAAP